MTVIARQDHQASIVHQEAVVPSPSGTGLEGVRTAVDVCVNLSDVLCLMAWSGGNARKLAGETASASTAVAQIASTISDIADLGAGAEEQAAQARSLVVSGAAQVEASGAAMSAIAGAFGELDSRLGELRRSSDSIGSFADAIQRVANQTKLLALNATIEAARAGTAGRGFAVVAAEVKALSEEASHTAALIRGQLDALGGVTAAMTEAMSTGAARVREGRATAQAVASDMDKITARVADTAVGIGRIASMLGERRVAMNDLVRGLGEINRLAEQSQTDTAAATDVLMRTEAVMDQFMTREAEQAGPDADSCRLKADHMVWKRELAECLAGVRGTDARGRSRLNEPFGAGFGRIATTAGAGSGAHSRLASLARPLAQAASDMMRHLAGGEMDAAVSDYMTMDGLSQDALTAMTTLADGVGRLPAH